MTRTVTVKGCACRAYVPRWMVDFITKKTYHFPWVHLGVYFPKKMESSMGTHVNPSFLGVIACISPIFWGCKFSSFFHGLLGSKG